MAMNPIHFRACVVRLCCVALLSLLCSGCASNSKTTTASKTKEAKAKPATLSRNAQKEVVAAEFLKTALSIKQIAALSKHAELKEITFYECSNFSDKVCDELAKLEGVTAVHFIRCPVDDSTLAELSKMANVVQLTLSNSEVTSKGMAALKDWKNLKRLTLKGKIKSGALEGLSQLQQLESLEIGLAGFSLRQLAGKPLPHIRILRIPFADVSDDDLSSLPEWKTLEQFEFRADKLTDAGVAHLTKFSSLKKLSLADAKITDDGLSELLKMTKLEILNLYGCKKITDLGMKIVATMPALKNLQLEESGVTGAGLMNLEHSKSLRNVGIGEKKASKAEIAKAAEAMPSCQFERIQQGPGPMD